MAASTSVDREEEEWILGHLPRLLFNRRRDEELATLIDRRWMRRKIALDGHYRGLLNDLEIARRSAERRGPTAVGLQIRWALATSSIASIGSRIPPILFPLFIESRLMSVTQATTLASQVLDPMRSTESLIGIARVQKLTRLEREQVLRVALLVPWYGSVERFRPGMFAEIATLLEEGIARAAYNQARESSNLGVRPLLMAIVIPKLPDSDKQSARHEVLSIGRDLPEAGERALALSYMAPHEGPALIEEILELLPLIADKFVATQVIEQIADWAPFSLYPKLIAISEASSVSFRSYLALLRRRRRNSIEKPNTESNNREFLPVPASLQADLVSRLITNAREEDDKTSARHRWCEIATIDPKYLPGIVDRLSPSSTDSEWGAVATMIPYLDATGCRALIRSVRQNFPPSFSRKALIAELAPFLTTADYPDFLGLTQTIGNLDDMLECMGHLANRSPSLGKFLIPNAYGLSIKLHDTAERNAALAGLRPYLRANYGSPEAKDLSPTAVDLDIEQLRDFASRLPYRLFEWPRVEAIEKLARNASADQLDRVIEIITAVNLTDFEERYGGGIYLLTSLLPRMTQASFDRVLSLSKRLANPPKGFSHGLFSLWADLASRASESTYAELQQVIETIDNPGHRQAAAGVLGTARGGAPALNPEQLAVWLNQIPSQTDRNFSALALLPHVSETLHGELLKDAGDAAAVLTSWGGQSAEESALLRIAEHVSLDELGSVLTVTRISHHLRGVRSAAIKKILRRIQELPLQRSQECLRQIIASSASHGRGPFLHDLANFGPAIQMGGTKAVADTIRAVVQISSWWINEKDSGSST